MTGAMLKIWDLKENRGGDLSRGMGKYPMGEEYMIHRSGDGEWCMAAIQEHTQKPNLGTLRVIWKIGQFYSKNSYDKWRRGRLRYWGQMRAAQSMAMSSKMKTVQTMALHTAVPIAGLHHGYVDTAECCQAHGSVASVLLWNCLLHSIARAQPWSFNIRIQETCAIS